MAAHSVQRAQNRGARGSLIWRSSVIVLLLVAAVVAAVAQPVRLGLDLRGGTQVEVSPS